MSGRQHELGADVAPGSSPASAGLAELLRELRRDLPIEHVEAHEARLKAGVGRLLGGSRPMVAEAVRVLAAVGLILKYKPYAVKAAHPSGYSIFLQQPGEGFSFQLHREKKHELFHVLATNGLSRVFLAPEAEWPRIFDPGRIAAWLAGGADPGLDRFSVVPEPGDVFPIESTDIVHTVLGCMLEEFASDSTDLVKRLHDQNRGRKVPPGLNRASTEIGLQALPAILPRRVWRLDSHGWSHSPLEPSGPPDAQVWRVDCGPILARWVRLQHTGALKLEAGPKDLVLARVSEGCLAADCRDRSGAELVRFERLDRGDCFVVPPGGAAEVRVASSAPAGAGACASVHQVPLALALATAQG